LPSFAALLIHKVIHHSLLTEFDIALFMSGKHYKLYEKLGSHSLEIDGQSGTYFLEKGELYKYSIEAQDGQLLEKGDPFAMFWEKPPRTSSITWDLSYDWKDADWLEHRRDNAGQAQPYSVYEVHIGSWKKYAVDKSLSYQELAIELVQYVQKMGFTHVEFMPVMEHPYDPSWGYQISGYFAPTSRFGTPQDFMALVDAFHQAGIGVILDWVPSHFPEDVHGLAKFDGSCLYEHADPRKGFHPDWKSLIFNYGRKEIRSFLISNALFWLDKYHIDGLRVDAVASMLYLDYSRKQGEWIPNEFGGNENLEAVSFLKEFNETVYSHFPDTITIAEESTAWKGVSRPTYLDGLGFGQKWMMGWMHDTLNYLTEDSINRKYHHNKITFSLVYSFSENFMLPLSHDEVVHGKGPIIDRMPGDEWQRFANLRLLYSYMFTHPGTKLLFMGNEFGQTTEWSLDNGLQWGLLEQDLHRNLQELLADLNQYYKNTPAIYEKQFLPEGFEWVSSDDGENSMIAYIRKGVEGQKIQLVVCNFTPVVRENFNIGVIKAGQWREILSSDNKKYGGSGVKNEGVFMTNEWGTHDKPFSLTITLPPLATVIFEPIYTRNGINL